MSVFTVYFCGTGSNKFDTSNNNFWNGELVSTLAANNTGKEFADWIIIDGPGSGNYQLDELWVEHTEHYNWYGNIKGAGWEENVKHALSMMKGKFEWQRTKLTKEQYDQLKDAGISIPDAEKTGSWFWRTFDYGDRKVTPQELQEQIVKIFRKDQIIPTQVNLVGWSRGGISCHMLANAMLEDDELKDVPVNIFAVDPVPGSSNFQTEKVSLGENVKEYVAFYARDERSKGFSCVIPDPIDDETAVHIYPMPGKHATLVGNATLNGGDAPEGKPIPKDLYEPGEIVRHFAEVCLKRWGTGQDKTLKLGDQQIADLHESMADKSEEYARLHAEYYVPGLRTENDHGERYVTHGTTGCRYSAVHGDKFDPNAGLAADFSEDDSIYDVIK